MTTLKEQIRSDNTDVFFNTDDFADSCRYSGEQFGGTFPFIAHFHDSVAKQLYGDITSLDGITAIGVDFLGTAANITAEVPTAIPVAGDEITWTDARNQPRVFVVFPRVAGTCFEFTPDRSMVRIYTIADDELARAVYTASDETLIPWRVVVGQKRGGEIYNHATTDMEKVVRMNVYGPRETLAAKRVNEIQRYATVKICGEDWAVDLPECQLGTELVKLGVLRREIMRHEEMESHGSVR